MKKRLLFIVFIITLIVLFLRSPVGLNAQVRKLTRVYLTSLLQAKELIEYDLDLASHRIRRYADVVITEEEERFLLQRGFALETLVDDLKRSFQDRFAARTDMGEYHTYQEMIEELLNISNSYPAITMLNSIGQSIEGREIWAMKVSDNPTFEDGDEPDLLYMANMHAREVVTPEVVLYLLHHLVENYGTDSTVTDLVDNREFWLIPTQNPDGHVYVEQVDPWWRKNRRDNGGGIYGVDLNRNYGYQWGYDDIGSSPNPWSQTYRGTGPFSEPESQAIRQLCLTHSFVVALSFHSYGRLWLFPWGYIPENTPHHDVFLELANKSVAFNGYTPGNPASGTIYITNGGTDDYFYGEQVEKDIMFGFTPEVADEFWPPEDQIPALSEENLGPSLYLAQIAPILEDNPWRLLPPATPVLDPITEIEDDTYLLSWTIDDDPNNPAVLYQLDELTGFTVITDDAESGDSNWDFERFSVSEARYYSSSHSFYSGQGDNLDGNMTTTFPMIVEQESELTFWTWYDIENHWDYAYLEISSDGGDTFISIPGNITTNSNPNGMNLGNGITGSSGSWLQGVFDLSGFAGETLLVRFRYVTDGFISREGFYADDIFPVPIFENSLTLADDLTETNFTVSGQESGVYFYRARARDQEEQWGAWSPLEDVVVESGSVTFEFPQPGWYLISLPVSPQDNSVDTLFPSAIAAFGWDAEALAYLAVDNLETTKGYWILIPSQTSATVAGQPLSEYSAHYIPGWHLIGSVRESVDFSHPDDDPAGSIIASFGWESTQMHYYSIYPVPPGTGVLESKEGFWLAVAQECDLTIGGASQVAVAASFHSVKSQNFGKQFGLHPPTFPKVSDFVSDQFQRRPKTFQLSQNYPNPFNPQTAIEYQLPETGWVSLKIYNMLGETVRTLVNENQSAHTYKLLWDGKSDAGLLLPSGVYLYRIETGKFVAHRTLILLR